MRTGHPPSPGALPPKGEELFLVGWRIQDSTLRRPGLLPAPAPPGPTTPPPRCSQSGASSSTAAASIQRRRRISDLCRNCGCDAGRLVTHRRGGARKWSSRAWASPRRRRSSWAGVSARGGAIRGGPGARSRSRFDACGGLAYRAPTPVPNLCASLPCAGPARTSRGPKGARGQRRGFEGGPGGPLEPGRGHRVPPAQQPLEGPGDVGGGTACARRPLTGGRTGVTTETVGASTRPGQKHPSRDNLVFVRPRLHRPLRGSAGV